MVISGCLSKEQYGRAIVAPLRSQKLCEGAEFLWTAERCSSGKPRHRISARWGCIAIRQRPGLDLPSEVLRSWTRFVSNERYYANLDRATDEIPLVDKSGCLDISWPESLDGSDLGIDCLLATATSPTICEGTYPTTRKIAHAWSNSPGREHRYYFYNNKCHGIETFQDSEIERLLSIT